MSNRIREAFDDIHAEKELKEHTKEYLRRNVYQKKRTLWTAPVRIAAATVCLFLVVLAGGSWLYLVPTAYISIDINPSLELGVNLFDRIVSVEGFNDDGARLAEQLDIKYMEYNDALEQILSDQSVEEYLARSDLIAITVVCDNEAKNSEMMEQVENCSSSHSSVSCHSGSTDMIDSLSGEDSASYDENTAVPESTGVSDDTDGESGHHSEEHDGGQENRHRHNR